MNIFSYKIIFVMRDLITQLREKKISVHVRKWGSVTRNDSSAVAAENIRLNIFSYVKSRLRHTIEMVETRSRYTIQFKFCYSLNFPEKKFIYGFFPYMAIYDHV